MDKFVSVIGIIGLVLLVLSLVVIIQSLVCLFKKRIGVKSFLTSFLIFLISCGFGLAFASISLFLYTFSRFSHQEKIGYVFAEAHHDTIGVTFINEKTRQSHIFRLVGDQWMVEGHILRWNTSLRWLGAGSYVCITRFAGRDIEYKNRSSVYQIAPENKLWRYLLKYSEKIPFVDATYGIGAFQYPSKDPFYLYLNDTGFIIKKK